MPEAFDRRKYLRERKLERGAEAVPFSGCEQFKNSFRFGPPRDRRKDKSVPRPVLKRGCGTDLDREHRAMNKQSTFEEVARRAEVTAMRRLEKIAKNSADEGKAMRAAALIVAMVRGGSVSADGGVVAGKGSAMSDELRKAIAAVAKDTGDEAAPAPVIPPVPPVNIPIASSGSVSFKP